MSEIIRKFNKRNVIKLSHALNYAHYNVGIVALDIIYTLIAQITNEDTSLNSYQVSIVQLEQRFGRKLNRKSLENAKQELISEPILFAKSNNEDPYPWVEKFELNSRKGSIEIKLHPNLTEHLIKPKLYAMGNLESILAIKSIYTKRIYMLCSQFVAGRKFSIGMKPLRNMLSTPSSLNNAYGNFKERVLVPAIKTINDSSDLKVKYDEIKTGRYITDLEIIVIKKDSKVIRRLKSGVVGVENWLNGYQEREDFMDTEVA
ncbi:replication initiation protein [Sulfuricurvum sp.]|uniref:replication initiation protein n=1 Tax=Sulfuricurvum sp. TaxID=2025608 RepID=UPI002612D984|nr:replication initiation protein [Sulfuricurvum sp.]MDD4950494.1 replication initiation protein [Sulfuricurvum sp.]